MPSLQQKRVRKSIKNFFGTANKFQKVMKRGVYFACLIYHEERVLVTNEEVLPIIEIGKCPELLFLHYNPQSCIKVPL